MKMEVAVVAEEADGDGEERGERFAGKDAVLGTVGEDGTLLEQDDAVHFRNDLGYMMGDENDAQAGLCELAHGVAKLELRGNVESVGRFVEEKCLWIVNQGAGDERAFGFTRGHLCDSAAGEMVDAEAFEGRVSESKLVRCGMMMGKDMRAAEESGKHDVEAGGVGGARSEQILRDDAEVGAQFKDVPAVLAHDGDGRTFAGERIAFARDGLDERGFAATVGTKDADVFAGVDAQGEVAESRQVTANHGDVVQIEQGRVERIGHVGRRMRGSLSNRWLKTK